jgi:hypothetical protein
MKPPSAEVCLEMKDILKVNIGCTYSGNPAAFLDVALG